MSKVFHQCSRSKTDVPTSPTIHTTFLTANFADKYRFFNHEYYESTRIKPIKIRAHPRNQRLKNLHLNRIKPQIHANGHKYKKPQKYSRLFASICG